MGTEVNKLIFNTIIKYKSLYLPDIGTLCIVRQPATISSHNEILAPHYTVEFRNEKSAISLIDIISSQAGVEPSRATEIYNRWLERSWKGDEIIIDRVGALKGEIFKCDRELIKQLNINNQPLTITRQRGIKPLWVILTCLVAICVGYVAWLYNDSQNSTQNQIVEYPAIVTDATELDKQNIVSSSDVDTTIAVNEDVSNEIEEPTVEVEENIVTIEEQVIDVDEDWRDSENIRHWVVFGSYSTIANAKRAISDIERRIPEAKCEYFKLGSMYAVAVFGSSNLADCQEFKLNHAKDFPQAWVYTPKRYK